MKNTRRLVRVYTPNDLERGSLWLDPSSQHVYQLVFKASINPSEEEWELRDLCDIDLMLFRHGRNPHELVNDLVFFTGTVNIENNLN